MSNLPATVLIASPVGAIELTTDGNVLTSLTIRPEAQADTAPSAHPVLDEAAVQIADYFAGTRHDFDLPLAPLKSERGTALRDGIAAIPYGETLSYGALANILTSAPRAIGQACRRNPFPIIIPCHRVTSAAGSPEHYSGGDGVNTKAWLNAFEQKNKEK